MSYWASGVEALAAIQPELILLLGNVAFVELVKLVKVSYWAQGAEALVAIQPELILLLGSVRLFLYRLKPLKLTQLQEPYNSLIPMSLWIIWLAKIIFS